MNTNGIRKLVAGVFPYWVRKIIPLRISQHLYFNGVFTARFYGKKTVKLLHVGNQIENEIYWRGFEGCHEKKSMQIFASIIQNLAPKVVWDIGANSGTYGMLAKALKPDCDVVFFEPIPKATAIIEKNLSTNNFEAKIFEMALGDFDGVGEIFFEKGHDFATSVTVNKNTVPKGTKSDSMKIQVRRLDSITAELGLTQPDLVKLDVETYEYEVLTGWGTQFPDEAIFLIEVLQADLAAKLTEFFPESRYLFWNIDDSNSTMRQVTKLGKSDFYNFLVVPKILSNSIEKFLMGTQ